MPRREQKEQTYTISQGDPGTKTEVFRRGVESVDPDGSQYPAVLRILAGDPRNEDPASLLEQVLSLRSQIDDMRFTLERGGTVYTNILAEPPKPTLGFMGELLSGGTEKEFIRRTNKPTPVPFRKRVEAYLDQIIGVLQRRSL